jgi:hypothetical protein
MLIEKKTFPQPALLLGNGLNNYVYAKDKNDKARFSYKDLLADLAVEMSSELKPKDVESILRNDSGINYPEFYDTLRYRLDENDETSNLEKSKRLKMKVQGKIRNIRGGQLHESLVHFAIKERIPILTTNYDTSLLTTELLSNYTKKTDKTDSDGIRPTHKKDVQGYTVYYPWHSYYTNRSEHKIDNPLTEFGVWHIHGFGCYWQSMLIGIEDYYNAIRRFDLALQQKRDAEKAGTQWQYAGSWLDIFLHNDLIILGLSLESQEISLRRLLMKRMQYIRRNNLQLSTRFIYNSDYVPDKPSAGKRYFFESMGIEVLGVPGVELYEQWECD